MISDGGYPFIPEAVDRIVKFVDVVETNTVEALTMELELWARWMDVFKPSVPGYWPEFPQNSKASYGQVFFKEKFSAPIGPQIVIMPRYLMEPPVENVSGNIQPVLTGCGEAQLGGLIITTQGNPTPHALSTGYFRVWNSEWQITSLQPVLVRPLGKEIPATCEVELRAMEYIHCGNLWSATACLGKGHAQCRWSRKAQTCSHI